MQNKLELGIDKTYGWIKKVFSFLNAIMVTILTGVVILDVFGTLIRIPIIFTAELTGLMFTWITALAGVLIAMDEENIALTFVKDKFPPKGRFWVNCFIDVICLVFCSIMFKSSIDINFEMYTQRMPLFGFSKVALYSSMSVLFGMCAIVMLLQLVRRVIRRKENA